MTAALTLLLSIAPAIPAAELPPPSVLNDLADAPHAGDRFRFPDSATAEVALRFNAAFVARMQAERELWPADRQPVFIETIEDSAALRLAWWHLSWAQWPYREGWAGSGPRLEWQIRLDLKRLRECIGEEAYRAGEIGPVVPVWRYRSLK